MVFVQRDGAIYPVEKRQLYEQREAACERVDLVLFIERHHLLVQLRFAFVSLLQLLDERRNLLHLALALERAKHEWKRQALDDDGDKDESEPIAKARNGACSFD